MNTDTRRALANLRRFGSVLLDWAAYAVIFLFCGTVVSVLLYAIITVLIAVSTDFIAGRYTWYDLAPAGFIGVIFLLFWALWRLDNVHSRRY